MSRDIIQQMGRMIFDLTDEDREALERVRIALGARSHAETLRRLIRDFEPGPTLGQKVRAWIEADPVPKLTPKPVKAARPAPTEKPKPAAPANRPNRLKGQWKAP